MGVMGGMVSPASAGGGGGGSTGGGSGRHIPEWLRQELLKRQVAAAAASESGGLRGRVPAVRLHGFEWSGLEWGVVRGTCGTGDRTVLRRWRCGPRGAVKGVCQCRTRA